MEPKRYNKLITLTKKQQTHSYREPVPTSGGKAIWGGKVGAANRMSHRDVLYNKGHTNTYNLFNNCKWSVTFQSCIKNFKVKKKTKVKLHPYE